VVKPVRPAKLLDILGQIGAIVAGPVNDAVPESAETSGEVRKDTSSDKQLRILLAEDNPINQKLALAVLKKKGWETVPVMDGREALTKLETEQFDLVLMDVQMPVMDGYEATKQIRNIEKTTGTHMPIIAMTAHAMRGDREKCLEAGMDDYVSKPMKAVELFAAVDRVLACKTEQERPVKTDKPEIDLTNIIEAVDGDMTVVKELVGDFLNEIPKQINNLRDSIQTADAHHVERQAHSLKGAVANFGAKAAQSLAFELERMGRESRLDGSVEIFDRLEKEMNGIQTYFSGTEWQQPS
jgi:CheY-like chemotaxis protein/HPt (histidine-containing phosphotransfer) domain-containing protein